MDGIPEETISELLRGSIDTHMHTGPDLFPRSVTDLEAAVQAREAGMAAILIKSHHTLTADRAALATSLSGLPVFGGLTLNYFVGGFNRRAVKAAIRFGARQIWMPTISSRHYLRGVRSVPMFEPELPPDLGGLTIWDDNGEVLPEVAGILELMARHDVILGSGHLSVPEIKALVRVARQVGVDRILITHPQADFVGMTIADMKELAAQGAILEHHYVVLTSVLSNPCAPEEVARAIKEVGAEHCIMATDGGQQVNPVPVQMMRSFVREMLAQGVTAREIHTMIHDNPRRILKLE